jgi:hypothetical protein
VTFVPYIFAKLCRQKTENAPEEGNIEISIKSSKQATKLRKATNKQTN